MTDGKADLALRRERQLADLRLRSGTAERIEQGFACATQNRAFRATLARMPPSQTFAVERFASAEGSLSIFGRLSRLLGPRAAVTVSAAELDIDSTPCPGCCLRDIWTLCRHCHAFVCAGKSEGSRFVCRASCGTVARRIPLTAFDASGGAASGGQTAIGQRQVRSLPGKR